MKKNNLLFLLVLLMGCKENYVKETADLPTIKQAKVVKLQPTDQPLPIYASGILQGDENIKLSFKIGGIIQSVLVDEGDVVKKGQVLATLNQSEIAARVQQAKSNLDKIERDLKRFQKLYQDSAATLSNVQDLETAFEVAKAELQVAQFNQKYSRIIAPASGQILTQFSEFGELIEPGLPLFILKSQKAGMVLSVGLSDKEVVLVKNGDQSTVTFDAYPEQTFPATVSNIASEANPRTGTYAVEIRLAQSAIDFKSGFFAKATIYPSIQRPYYKVPMTAVISGDEKQVAIYVPEANKVKKATFQPLFIGDDFIAVSTADLSSTNILTEGAAYLQEDEQFKKIN